MTPWSSKYPSSHSVVDEVEAAILLDPSARLGADGFYHLPEGK